MVSCKGGERNEGYRRRRGPSRGRGPTDVKGTDGNAGLVHATVPTNAEFHTLTSSTVTRQAALEHEAERFSEMAATPESESLIGLFEGSTALKKNRFGKPEKKVR